MTSSTSSSDPTFLLTIIKVLSIVLLITLSIVLGLAPFKWSQLKKNPKLIAYSNSFSAGLFLGMGILHLLFESIQDYEKYIESQRNGGKYYPIPLLIVIISFSLVLFLEKVIFYAHEFIHPIEEEAPNDESSDEDKISLSHQPLLIKQASWPCNPNREEETFKKMIGFTEKVARTAIGNEKLNKEIESCMHCQVKEKRSSTADSENLFNQKLEKGEKYIKYDEHQQKHGHSTSPYPILIALSIHGAFEGVAVGIQTIPREVVNLVFAVLLHKWAEALTLGIALFKGNISKKVVITQIIIFSLAGPAGIVVGWVVVGESLLISSIFKAISAGTFLYISATELVVEEFSISSHMFLKYFLYLLGIAMMSLLLLLD